MPDRPQSLDGWVDFETMTTELDGEQYPVTKLFDARGRVTDDAAVATVYFAGRGDRWFSARIIREVSYDA